MIPTLKKFRLLKIWVKRAPYSQRNKLFGKVIYWTFSPEISRCVLIPVITYVIHKGVFFFNLASKLALKSQLRMNRSS
jgi:hypothetical protein